MGDGRWEEQKRAEKIPFTRMDADTTQINADNYTPCREGYSRQGHIQRLRRDV